MRRLALFLLAPAALALAGCYAYAGRCCDEAGKPAVVVGAGVVVAHTDAPAKPINETCPVLLGNAVDRKITTVWNGKLVGFCCPMCKAKFEKNPEKYAKNLP